MTKSPEHLVEGKYTFAQLVDLDRLEAVIRSISKALGLALGVTSYPKQEQLINTGWQRICTDFHRACSAANKVCERSNLELTQELVELKEVKVKKCAHGLIDGATPIIIKGAHVANLFGGQVFFEKPEIEEYRKRAQQYGFDEEAYLAALSQVTIVPEKQFVETMTFLVEIAIILAEQGLSNLESQQLAKESQEATALLRTIVEQSQVPMCCVSAKDLSIMLVNQACIDFHNYDIKEGRPLKLTPHEWNFRHFDGEGNPIAPEDLPLLRALQGQTTTDMEMRVDFDDGSSRYCLASAVPIKNEMSETIAGLVVFPDITDRKLAQQALKDSESRFRELAEMLPETIFETDMELNLTYANERSYQLFGYTKDDFDSGLNGLQMIVAKDRERAKTNLGKRLQGEKIAAIEYTGLKKDNTTFPLLLHIEPITFKGKTSGFRGIIIDITTRKELESHYLQAQKVESIGRLAGGIAHDLNNLLTPILGYGQMLQDEFSAKDGRRNTVEEIIEAGKRARNLVRQLLAFSRKQTMNLAPLDVDKTIIGFEKLLRRTIRENIEITLNLSSAPYRVMADIGQIEQVIMNLAINAADAMPDCGQLLIETHKSQMDGQDSSSKGVLPGEYVVLKIKDTGFGMNEETLEKVFEPFFSTKGDKGTGLGLATVYGIIKQHNGHIFIESQPNDGTTISVLLPKTDLETNDETVEPKTSVSVEGMETILLVEDNEQVRTLANAMLSRMGYSVIVASSGEELFERLATYAGPADLLLTDVVMPGLNGKEIYTKLRKMYPHVRVLYMSGYAADIIVRHGVETRLLNKPFTYEGLALQIREVLEQD